MALLLASKLWARLPPLELPLLQLSPVSLLPPHRGRLFHRPPP